MATDVDIVAGEDSWGVVWERLEINRPGLPIGKLDYLVTGH